MLQISIPSNQLLKEVLDVELDFVLLVEIGFFLEGKVQDLSDLVDKV